MSVKAAPVLITKLEVVPAKLTANLLTPHTTRGTYQSQPIDPSGTKGIEIKIKPGEQTFPLDQLKGMQGADGIDPTNKEQYLEEEEFKKMFGIDLAAFLKLPVWKRQLEKKKHGLF